MDEPLVSIIMPCYNAEKHIEKAIESVINQTYKNWELIIIDDQSTDSSIRIINKYMITDERINMYQLDKKGGASTARNFGIKKASGQYIAFLDSDDLWKRTKLMKQIIFMQEKCLSFTYTYFGYIDENNNRLDLIRKSPKKITYKKALRGNLIGCLTVIIDVSKVGKVEIPYLKKRNDAALWLKILKRVEHGDLYPEVLSVYRKRSNSLSSGNKMKMLKYHYMLYRNSEGFNTVKSLYYCIWNIITFIIIKTKYEVKIEYKHE